MSCKAASGWYPLCSRTCTSCCGCVSAAAGACACATCSLHASGACPLHAGQVPSTLALCVSLAQGAAACRPWRAHSVAKLRAATRCCRSGRAPGHGKALGLRRLPRRLQRRGVCAAQGGCGGVWGSRLEEIWHLWGAGAPKRQLAPAHAHARMHACNVNSTRACVRACVKARGAVRGPTCRQQLVRHCQRQQGLPHVAVRAAVRRLAAPAAAAAAGPAAAAAAGQQRRRRRLGRAARGLLLPAAAAGGDVDDGDGDAPAQGAPWEALMLSHTHNAEQCPKPEEGGGGPGRHHQWYVQQQPWQYIYVTCG